MPLIRGTFFFEDNNKHGWSETIFTNKADLTLAVNAANSLMQFRRSCLGAGVRISYVRVSDDLEKRDSRIITVPIADGGTRVGDPASADIANTSLIVRIEALPKVRRTLYMRGLPDNCVTDSGKFTPTPQFVFNFDNWAARLIDDGWSCRTRDGTAPLHNIVGITQVGATGVVTIQTFTPHLLELGKPFVIRGVKGAQQVNGTWLPFAIPSGDTVTIKLNVLIGTWIGQGTLAKLTYVLHPITDVKVIRVSHRISGRPFDSPVGRRRARARA